MAQKTEWDPAKASTKSKKHQVSFEEASTVFEDVLLITFLDVEHSIDEDRFITLGRSGAERLLMVAHTDRNGVIRIISARKATQHERRFYEEVE